MPGLDEDLEEVEIPPPPPTMRATPLAKAIAHELDPSIERFAVKVLAEFHAFATDVMARLDRDSLKTEVAIKELRALVGTHHQMVTGYLTTMQASIVEIATTQKKQGAEIRAHAGRIRAVELEVRRIKAKLSKRRPSKKARKRAAHAR